MRRLLAAVLAAASITALPAPASAATTFTEVKLTAVVSGSSVKASVKVRASKNATVKRYGICVRDAAGKVRDFPGRRSSAVVSKRGVSYSATKTFPAGTFTYYACFKRKGTWVDLAPKTFVVPGPGTAATARPTAPATAAPTAPASAPATAWRRVYTQDFTANAALGQVERTYGTELNGYRDGTPTTWRNGGCWYPSKTLSVHDGVLDTYLHRESGLANGCQFLSAAPVPYGWRRQVYGQFTVRMKADPVRGYKTAFLLWPESNVWGEGEIDFPEADLPDPVTGAVHRLSPGDPNSFLRVDSTTNQTGWHDYTIQWLPGHVRMLIDGVLQRDFTADVPTTPHYWALQTETGYAAPAPSASGHVLIDSVSVDAYVGG